MLVKTYPEIPTDPGVTRQVLSENAELMVVAFRFNEIGAEGKRHSHPNTQSTYVQSGRFVFSVSGEEFEVEPGDSFVIPSGAVHSCRCIQPRTLIATFTPRRDDFL